MPIARTRFHCSSPSIKATIFFAISRTIIITVTILRFIIQVLSHPHLIANFYRLVNLSITGVDHFAVIDVWIQVRVCHTATGLLRFARNDGGATARFRVKPGMTGRTRLLRFARNDGGTAAQNVFGGRRTQGHRSCRSDRTTRRSRNSVRGNILSKLFDNSFKRRNFA